METEQKQRKAELQSIHDQFIAYQNAKAQEVIWLTERSSKTSMTKQTPKRRDWSPAGAANRRKISHTPQQTVPAQFQSRPTAASDLLKCSIMGKSLAALSAFPGPQVCSHPTLLLTGLLCQLFQNESMDLLGQKSTLQPEMHDSKITM